MNAQAIDSTVSTTSVAEGNPKAKLPSAEELQFLFSYCPRTGRLRRSRRGLKKPGKAAKGWPTATNGHGYLVIKVSGYGKQAVHDIVWAMHGRGKPEGMQIDHVDGVKTHNRIENLRLATRSQNQANTAAHRNGASGYKGVTWDKCRGKWQAQIKVNGLNRKLGYFNSREMGALVYSRAAEKIFGEFAQSTRACLEDIPRFVGDCETDHVHASFGITARERFGIEDLCAHYTLKEAE